MLCPVSASCLDTIVSALPSDCCKKRSNWGSVCGVLTRARARSRRCLRRWHFRQADGSTPAVITIYTPWRWRMTYAAPTHEQHEKFQYKHHGRSALRCLPVSLSSGLHIPSDFRLGRLNRRGRPHSRERPRSPIAARSCLDSGVSIGCRCAGLYYEGRRRLRHLQRRYRR
jgi:hypothetical protein